jgi:hypothetical protein
MHADLHMRRRLLLVSYQSYLKSEAEFDAALRDMRSWFPSGRRPYRASIGNPGSPIRRLYDQRDRALLRLAVAREKFETAKRSLEGRRPVYKRRTLLITFTD